MPDSKKVFSEIVEDPHPNKLAVFDLDSTLFGVSGRNQAILRDMVKQVEFKKQYPEAAEKIATIKLSEKDWGIKKSLFELGLQDAQGLFQFAKNFWNQHFFSNDYLIHDVPYPGALEYVKGLEASGVNIYYLTGRDEPNMRRGTIEILEKWGFPTKSHEERLHMKPHKGHSLDQDYKSNRFREFLKGDEKVWFFENEPVIINRVLRDHPEINLIYIDTVHSGRAEAPEGLPVINWGL